MHTCVYLYVGVKVGLCVCVCVCEGMGGQAVGKTRGGVTVQLGSANILFS